MTATAAKAAESVAEAALILRTATAIADPYLRADRIWEAVERLRESFVHASTRACEEHTFALEETCDGTQPPPGCEELNRHARSLEEYARTLRGLGVGEPEMPAGLCAGVERA